MENIKYIEKRAFEYKFRRTFEKLNEMFSIIECSKSIIEEQIVLNYKTSKNFIAYHNDFLYNKLIETFISCSITLSHYRDKISECKIKDMEKMLELTLEINENKIYVEYVNGYNKLQYIDWCADILCENAIIQDNTNLKINILDVKNYIEKKYE